MHVLLLKRIYAIKQKNDDFNDLLAFRWQRTAQQIIGREGETVALYVSFFFHINLRVAGFAPRQLNR